MASSYQTKIIDQYKKEGYGVMKLAKTNKNGVADLLVSKPNERPILIETKEANDTLKPLQIAQNLLLCESMGFEFIVMKDGIGKMDVDSSVYKTDLF